MNTQLFNAVLVTDRGLIIDDVEDKELDEVIPYLQDKHDLHVITHFVIRLIKKIDTPKKTLD